MGRIRHKTLLLGPRIPCACTMADFQSSQCEVAQSEQNTLEMQKYCFQYGRAGCAWYDETVHELTSSGKRKQMIVSKISPVSNANFLEDSQYAWTTVLSKAYDI